jgi:hypothetical protein
MQHGAVATQDGPAATQDGPAATQDGPAATQHDDASLRQATLVLGHGRASLLATEASRALLVEAAGPGAEVRFDEPMARHTTLRIGGPADAWVAPADPASVARLRALCAMQQWPCLPVGGGSNLLVRDGGVRGVVLSSERLRALAFEPAPTGRSAGSSSSAACPAPSVAG